MSETPYHIKREKSLVFSFISVGEKGRIDKIIRYDEINEAMFNLAFGDKIGDSFDFNDSVVSNNKDVGKVIATVIATLDLFFEEFPDKFVHFTGSTPSRTKMYCWIIKNHQQSFEVNYKIYGGIGIAWEPFQPSKDYDFLLISRK